IFVPGGSSSASKDLATCAIFCGRHVPCHESRGKRASSGATLWGPDSSNRQPKECCATSPVVTGSKIEEEHHGGISGSESSRSPRRTGVNGNKPRDGTCGRGAAGNCRGGFRLRIPAASHGRPLDGARVGGERHDQQHAGAAHDLDGEAEWNVLRAAGCRGRRGAKEGTGGAARSRRRHKPRPAGGRHT